jgi:hypothetical protein
MGVGLRIDDCEAAKLMQKSFRRALRGRSETDEAHAVTTVVAPRHAQRMCECVCI